MANEVTITADINRVSVFPAWKVNSGELNARQIKVNLSEDFDVCERVFCTFTDKDGNQQRSEVVDGYCSAPYFEKQCEIDVGVYGEVFEGDEITNRLSPRPAPKVVFGGSYIAGEGVSPVPTPDDFAELVKSKIPSIKIEYSQLISEDTIQFTPEQWDILINDETKIVFIEAPRAMVDAKYKIVYKCGTYEELPSRGALYYEIISGSAQGLLIWSYHLNEEERQLKMQLDASPFVNNDEPPTNGDVLKIYQDRISKAIPNIDYALPSAHLTIENSQITVFDSTAEFTLTDEQWNDFLTDGDMLRLSVEFEEGSFTDFTFIGGGYSGDYWLLSTGAYLDYAVLSVANAEHKKLHLSYPMAIIPTHRGLLSEGDLLKCHEDTIYPAVPNVDYITKEYFEDAINNIPAKKITETQVNVWDLDTGYYINPNGNSIRVVIDSDGTYHDFQSITVLNLTLYSQVHFWGYLGRYESFGVTNNRSDGTHSFWADGFIETIKSDMLAQTISSSVTDRPPSSKAVYDAIQAALYVDSEATV